MNKLYERLKPYHIQQDLPAGCSIASWLMIQNSIIGDDLTQEEFRDCLTLDGKRWLRLAGKGGSGVRSDVFHAVIVMQIKALGLGSRYLCEKVSVKKYPEIKLRGLIESVVKSETDFLIFNYDAHYSPLGDFMLGNIKILDVDFSGKHNGEFKYSVGDGERVFPISTFYRKLIKQGRSFLHIKRLA